MLPAKRERGNRPMFARVNMRAARVVFGSTLEGLNE
jgi:hypothetical protein